MEHEDSIQEALSSAGTTIASALRALGTGNASTDMGAIELLAMEIKNGSERIAGAIDNLAEAIRERP